ncbi:hypothetical protein JIR001_16730 [Polycladomyces abyssicola]|uniref:Uncharacterized protein n=1 Tax=Polycladomyces abyssicola TaxID=1125966 RepID=A0A8D5UEV2_9BACL|nr:hypothetical protein [Polycladomyces abyssicola]BCU81890.1 hypothetical protein JIR001_16730 [Polycladomyces abyssicola]
MKVTYKYETGEFNFVTGDRVKIVVIFDAREGQNPISYHGEITKVGKDGFWAVLDDANP